MTHEQFNALMSGVSENPTSNWLSFKSKTGELLLNKKPIQQIFVSLEGVALKYVIPTIENQNAYGYKPTFEYVFEFLTQIEGLTEKLRFSVSNDKLSLVEKLLVIFAEADRSKLYKITTYLAEDSIKNPRKIHSLVFQDAVTFKSPILETKIVNGTFEIFTKVIDKVTPGQEKARLKYFCDTVYKSWYGTPITAEETALLKKAITEGAPAYFIGKPKEENEPDTLPQADPETLSLPQSDDLPF